MTSDYEWRVEPGEWKTLAEQRLAARRLLSQLIGFEAEVEHSPEGVPFIPAHPHLYVSISHCRSAVAVAVSRVGAVGIDVESRRRVSRGLMERVCSAEELATIDAATDSTMCFLQLWTRKEAALKCLGTGIKGFESMVQALSTPGLTVSNLACHQTDIVAALARAE